MSMRPQSRKNPWELWRIHARPINLSKLIIMPVAVILAIYSCRDSNECRAQVDQCVVLEGTLLEIG